MCWTVYCVLSCRLKGLNQANPTEFLSLMTVTISCPSQCYGGTVESHLLKCMASHRRFFRNWGTAPISLADASCILVIAPHCPVFAPPQVPSPPRACFGYQLSSRWQHEGIYSCALTPISSFLLFSAQWTCVYPAKS